MSDQGLSIFDEPEETPDDQQPTTVIKAQKDAPEDAKPAARPAKKPAKPTRTKVPAVAIEEPQAEEPDDVVEDDADPQPTQQLPTTPAAPPVPVQSRPSTPAPQPAGSLTLTAAR